jgi:subtilisin family serine protease
MTSGVAAGDVRDLNGHGTVVASLAARASGDARLLIIRAGSSSGAFSDANEAAAIRYAVDHGARFVNLSLGGPRTSAVERSAAARARTSSATA